MVTSSVLSSLIGASSGGVLAQLGVKEPGALTNIRPISLSELANGERIPAETTIMKLRGYVK